MNKPKNFDEKEKEWKKKLEEAHDFALYKKEEIKQEQQELESLIKDIDPVELLSHISLLSQFFPEGKPESNQDLREKPILHFLTGLCLKNGNYSNRHPDNQEIGNFYVPITDGGEKPNFVSLDGSWIAMFDDHYLYGKDTPQLKIEPDLVKIIRILEVLHPVGYSNIASALLDFDHQARGLILKNMNELINKTKKDRKKHDFTVLYKEIDTGFTFVTQCGREGLRERLGTYCAMKKYQTKTRRWIGIGRDVLDDEWFVNEFLYLDFPWKSDPRMDELLKIYPFKRKGETCVDD